MVRGNVSSLRSESLHLIGGDLEGPDLSLRTREIRGSGSRKDSEAFHRVLTTKTLFWYVNLDDDTGSGLGTGPPLGLEDSVRL